MKKPKKGLAVKLYTGKTNDHGSGSLVSSEVVVLCLCSLIKMALIAAQLTTEIILVTLFSH